MSDRIVMLIIMRIKYRFPDYSLAPNANRAHYRYTNKENDMNKNLIQQLLGDDETRWAIETAIALSMGSDALFYDDIMVVALNKLNDTLVRGEMITIEVSGHMWVRGQYVRTEPDGKVEVLSSFGVLYTGKRVDFVVKSEEGEADV
jgi:hypothetical protein